MAFTASRVGSHTAVPTRAPDLVRWGPVVASVAIALGIFALLNSLWLAIAYGAEDDWVSGNLAWFVGGPAAFALLLAGLIAGVLAGVRGAGAGLANGTTAWGLVFVLSVTAVIPGAVNLTARLGAGVGPGGALGAAGGGFTAESALWTSFWSLLVGLVLAAIGGIVGGTRRRPVVLAEERPQEADPEGPGPAADGREVREPEERHARAE